MTTPHPQPCQIRNCGSTDRLEYTQMDCCTWRWRCAGCREASHRLTLAICWRLDQIKAEGRRRLAEQAA